MIDTEPIRIGIGEPSISEQARKKAVHVFYSTAKSILRHTHDQPADLLYGRKSIFSAIDVMVPIIDQEKRDDTLNLFVGQAPQYGFSPTYADIGSYALGAIEKEFPQFARWMISDIDADHAYQAVDLFTKILEKDGFPELKMQILDTCEQHMDAIIQKLSTRLDRYETKIYGKLFQQYLLRRPEQMDDVMTRLTDSLQAAPRDTVTSFVEGIFRHDFDEYKKRLDPWNIYNQKKWIELLKISSQLPWEKLEQASYHILQSVLEGRYGFSKQDAMDVLATWKQTSGFDSQGADTAENLFVIDALHSEDPAILPYLFHTWGIRCFGRYPPSILADQYRQKDDRNIPYGLIFYPHADYNGAFYSEARVLSDFYEQLQKIQKDGKQIYNVRVAETSNPFGAAKIILRSAREYGKIWFAVFAGHGSTNSIQFGPNKQDRLTSSDIKPGARIWDAIRDSFIEAPSVVFIACEVGRKGGLAEKASTVGAITHGAKSSTSPKQLSIRERNGKPLLAVQYWGGTKGMYGQNIGKK